MDKRMNLDECECGRLKHVNYKHCARCKNRFIAKGHLPTHNILLMCLKGHDHIVGPDQVERILREPCIWCKSPLYKAKWWNGTRYETGAPTLV